MALYRAQEGATISDLEQLQASISLPSTIKMVFSLRKFTKMSAVLLAVWSFYYLGSQASKREYGYVSSDPFHQIRAVYPSNDVIWSGDWDSPDSSSLDQRLERSEQNSHSRNAVTGMDTEGYPLVPSIDPLLHSRAIENSEWIDIYPSEVQYSAFAGRPLSIEPQSSNKTGQYWDNEKIVGDYTFNTTYMDVRCGPLEILPESAFPANVTPGMFTSINKTSSTSSTSALVLIDVWGRWNESYGSSPYADDTFVPLKIDGLTSGSLKVTCNVTNPIVKVRVHCSELACLVKAIQYNPPDITERPIHPLADDDFTALFFSRLLLSDGPPNPYYSHGTLVEQALGFYQAIWALTTGGSTIEESVRFQSARLTEYINSYHSLALLTTPGSSGIYNPGPETGYGFVDVKGGLFVPHYALSWVWIAISYVSEGILIAAAIYSFVLRQRTLAPDIFGYVSSVTRDNPHLMFPDGGSTMCGIDRARYLRNVKIRIGDVYGQKDDVGKVGVTIVQDSETIGPLRKERKYL
ncbi:hypothetical protein ES702_00242 [subsurface metagenome]